MSEPTAVAIPSVKATHFGIIAGLAMGPAVGLGLGRFAYALLLPAMRADLGWSYAVAGAMNTANAAGYLIGALVAAPLAARIGDKRSFLFGVLLTAVSLLATGLATDVVILALLRVATGAGGALSLITGGSLAAAAGGDGRGRPAIALGVFFGGAGFGMVVSAIVVPALVASTGWRSGWVALGALGLLAAAAATPALAGAPTVATHRSLLRHAFSLRVTRGMRSVLLSYVLFGVGYIAYTTFIVAYLRNRFGFSASDVTLFWGCVGLTATVAGFVWGPLLTRLAGGRGIALANCVVMFGAALPVLLPMHEAVYVSAVLFGGSFLIVPTSVTTFARKALPPTAWTSGIGVLTTWFAIGQCIGPWLSGEVSDGRFGVAGGLLASGVILAGAAIAALVQKEPG